MAKVVEGKVRAKRVPDDMRRWYTRTNFYTAEYIVMLALVGILLGVLSTLWYTFFQLLITTGFSGRSLAMSAAASIGALIVLMPVTFWIYSRVIGQEAAEPTVIHSRVRSVFQTIWLVIASLAVVSVAVTMVGALVSVLFGVESDVSSALVGGFVPGLFVIPTLVFGIFMVGKQASSQLVTLSILSLGSIALILLVANSIMIFVRRDATPSSSPETCTYRDYADGKCSYEDYRNFLVEPDTDSYNYQ